MTNVAPAAATGIGSLPGTDSQEWSRTIAGELPDFPHIPELPARGPGADLIGRTMALLADVAPDLAVELTCLPSLVQPKFVWASYCTEVTRRRSGIQVSKLGTSKPMTLPKSSHRRSLTASALPSSPMNLALSAAVNGPP